MDEINDCDGYGAATMAAMKEVKEYLEQVNELLTKQSLEYEENDPNIDFDVLVLQLLVKHTHTHTHTTFRCREMSE